VTERLRMSGRPVAEAATVNGETRVVSRGASRACYLPPTAKRGAVSGLVLTAPI
jgi:hypothetical protein